MAEHQDAMVYCSLSHREGCLNPDHEKLRIHYDVDIGMIPILKVLHDKGYETKYCCSGHADREFIGIATSIAFRKEYDFAPPNGFRILQGHYVAPTIIESIVPKRDKKHPITQVEAEAFINNNLSVLTQWAAELPIIEEFTEIGQAQHYPVSVPVFAAEHVQRMMDEGIVPYSIECHQGRIKGVIKGVVKREWKKRDFRMMIQDITPFTGVRCSEFDASLDDIQRLIEVLRCAE